MKYYHASPQHFHPGDVIGHHDIPVYMTQSPEPHYTIYESAIKDNWFVYEVVPLDKVCLGGCWDEAITNQAEVVRRVGNARGIANNTKKHFKAGYWKSNKGSQVQIKKAGIFSGNFASRRPYDWEDQKKLWTTPEEFDSREKEPY